MKKALVLVVLAVMVMTIALPVFGKGGMPAAHGVDGRTFGGAVSELAQTNPGALADHVSGNAGGIPGAHGLSGSEFGGAVSGLAQENPGALVEHVSRR